MAGRAATAAGRQRGDAGEPDPGSARLGAGVVLGGRAGYRLSAATTVDVDVDEARRLLADAESRVATEPALALAAAGRAVAILSSAAVLADEPDATGYARPAPIKPMRCAGRAGR